MFIVLLSQNTSEIYMSSKVFVIRAPPVSFAPLVVWEHPAPGVTGPGQSLLRTLEQTKPKGSGISPGSHPGCGRTHAGANSPDLQSAFLLPLEGRGAGRAG